jgi:hypothetical protein
LEIELSDFEVENATLTGDYLRHISEIVIGSIPTVLDVHFMCLFMSLIRILSQGSISTNLFDPMRHQVHLWKVAVGNQLHGNIDLVVDMIPPGLHFVLLLGQRLSFSMCVLVYLLPLHEFRSQGIVFSLRLFAGWPE